MKINHFEKKSILALSFCGLLLFSCQEEPIADEKVTGELSAKPSPTMKAGAIDLPGRVLASNCFQCHGTNGYAEELKIGEESASSIISDVNEFRTEDPRDNIMNVHAQAYTPEEIKLIANYISQQKNY